jgi:hypothetical protein
MCGSRRYEVRRRYADPDLRASDADRERVAQLLRDGAGDGRLDMDELSERLDGVYAAKTVGELRSFTRDLPVVSREPRLPAGRRRRYGPPRVAFIWVSVLLVTIWVVTGAGYFWPMWPILWFAFATMKSRSRRRAAGTYV